MRPLLELQFLKAAARLALMLLVVVSSAQAQNFPSKPIKIVVPFGAGGVADLTARTVGQKLAQILSQSVIIENKPGAGGIAAGEVVAKAPADGHTLLLMSNGTAVSSGLFKNLPFDAQRDFVPVSMLGTFDIALIVPENSPFKTVAELRAYSKANPGKLNLATVSVGSTQNLSAEFFKSAAGLDIQIVPFKTTPEVITALRGGSVQVGVEILGPLMPQISAKVIRVLAVMGDKSVAKLPNVPTLSQAGVQDAMASSWNALAAPAKTPKTVVVMLNKAIQTALNHPEIKAKLADLYVQAQPSSPEQLGELLASETRRWAVVIHRAKIEKQ